MENWIKADTSYDDIVISSRVRLARNLKDFSFPNKLDTSKGKEVVRTIEEALNKSAYMQSNFQSVYIWDTDEITSTSLLEKHLISDKLILNRDKSALIRDKDEIISLMINEEDHLRLQCIVGGLNLQQAYNEVNKIDDFLEESLNFAYDEEFGYLTTCPTNVGTGLRASVMVHLPALTKSGAIDRLINMLGKMGMTIRGLFGEGSKGYGNIYQVSNQVTLGPTEGEIIENLLAVVDNIISEEKAARERYLKSYEYETKDNIMRALGILRYATIITAKEALNLFSYVRLGIEMGIIKDIDKRLINSLLVETLSSTMQLNAGIVMSEKERDIKRAEIIRTNLKDNS
jgi:protein arginine kinase